MSDETGYVNDRDKYRRDEDGQLTVWGARDMLLHIVDDALLKVWNEESGVERSNTLPLDEVRAAYAVRLDRALDDVEDAYLRTHDRFGCVRMNESRVEGDGLAPLSLRHVCRMCAVVGELGEAEREAITESLAQLVRGEVMPALTAAEERMRETLREALAERDGDAGEDVLAHLARRACEASGYEALAASEDDEDRAVSEAMRSAARRARHVLRTRDEDTVWGDWDSAEDEACYDRPEAADQEDQVDARDVQAEPAVGRVGWETLGLQEALEVRPGDHLSFTLESQEDGRLQVRSLHVIRAGELEDEDNDEMGD